MKLKWAKYGWIDNKRSPEFNDSGLLSWCGRRDLNPYSLQNTPLKRARMPIPPRPQDKGKRRRTILYKKTSVLSTCKIGGKKCARVNFEVPPSVFAGSSPAGVYSAAKTGYNTGKYPFAMMGSALRGAAKRAGDWCKPGRRGAWGIIPERRAEISKPGRVRPLQRLHERALHASNWVVPRAFVP